MPTRRRAGVKAIRAEPATELDALPGRGRGVTGDGREPERRCLASGEVMPAAAMIRFVVGPDGMIVPDFSGRLPGRGLWLKASRDRVETAVARKLFARAARQAVTTPPDLAQWIEAVLVRRVLDLIGLARRAGGAIAGHDKVRAWLKAGKGGVLLLAADGSPSERSRMRNLAAGGRVIELLDAAELGAAFSRDHTVHAIVAPGGLARRLVEECGRLGGFRTGVSTDGTGDRPRDILERD